MSGASEGAEPRRLLIHGTTVALGPVAAILRGRSGSGKSDLALRFLARDGGGLDEPARVRRLVADDQTWLTLEAGRLFASAPPAIAGKLEVRGVGIITADYAARAEVKVHGATTVAFGLMKPQKAKIEQLAGVELAILPSSTTHGLADLVAGKADVAMLAEPLETAAAALNKNEPGLVDQAEYIGRHVGDAFIQFIVHPSNPVQKLTKAQLAAIYSGKIKNWSELGGNNLPVLVVGEPTSSPYRLIRDALAVAYAPDMRVVQNTNQTAIIVAQAPGAISNISTTHDVPERGKLKVVETELKLPLQLYLAYRKDAPAEVRRVIDAAQSVGNP